MTDKLKRRELVQSHSNIQWQRSNVEKYEDIIALLERHVVPEQYPEPETDTMFRINELGLDSRIYRDAIVRCSGYALLATDWIQPLAQWVGKRPCLEIMAGSGALSYALAQNGVDVLATDDGSWAEQCASWFLNPWTHVEKIDCVAAIEKYGAERPIIFCSWPYMDDNAYYALTKMRAVNPNTLMVYIGEWCDGATASDLFFDTIIPVEDEVFAAATRKFKSSFGIHDQVHLLK